MVNYWTYKSPKADQRKQESRLLSKVQASIPEGYILFLRNIKNNAEQQGTRDGSGKVETLHVWYEILTGVGLYGMLEMKHYPALDDIHQFLADFAEQSRYQKKKVRMKKVHTG